MIPIVMMPFSSLLGMMSSLTTMIFLNESSMRISEAVSCLTFASSGMANTD